MNVWVDERSGPGDLRELENVLGAHCEGGDIGMIGEKILSLTQRACGLVTLPDGGDELVAPQHARAERDHAPAIVCNEVLDWHRLLGSSSAYT